MIATPAFSDVRVNPLCLPLICALVCSVSLEEKYVVKCSPDSLDVVLTRVSVSTSMLVLVLVIHFLISWRLAISFIPWQLRVAILSMVAYLMGSGVVCPSCAWMGTNPWLAGPGVPDLRCRACSFRP